MTTAGKFRTRIFLNVECPNARNGIEDYSAGMAGRVCRHDLVRAPLRAQPPADPYRLVAQQTLNAASDHLASIRRIRFVQPGWVCRKYSGKCRVKSLPLTFVF